MDGDLKRWLTAHADPKTRSAALEALHEALPGALDQLGLGSFELIYEDVSSTLLTARALEELRELQPTTGIVVLCKRALWRRLVDAVFLANADTIRAHLARTWSGVGEEQRDDALSEVYVLLRSRPRPFIRAWCFGGEPTLRASMKTTAWRVCNSERRRAPDARSWESVLDSSAEAVLIEGLTAGRTAFDAVWEREARARIRARLEELIQAKTRCAPRYRAPLSAYFADPEGSISALAREFDVVRETLQRKIGAIRALLRVDPALTGAI